MKINRFFSILLSIKDLEFVQIKKKVEQTYRIVVCNEQNILNCMRIKGEVLIFHCEYKRILDLKSKHQSLFFLTNIIP